MTRSRVVPSRLGEPTMKRKIINKALNDDRISTCKRCGFGVFASHGDRAWQVRPTIGWVHNRCLP